MYTSAFKEYYGEPELIIIVTTACCHSCCIWYKPAVPMMSLHRGYAFDITITWIKPVYSCIFSVHDSCLRGRWRATDGRFYCNLQGTNVLILVFWWSNSSPTGNFLGKNQAANYSTYREQERMKGKSFQLCPLHRRSEFASATKNTQGFARN